MAYTKNDWACGDKITAEKLNRMEQGIEDAQNGYECTESYTPLTGETVTTVVSENQPTIAQGNFSYDSLITADAIKVVYDGVTYVCEKVQGTPPYISSYGGASASDATYDFSEYPFAITSANMPAGTTTSLTVPSENAGSHTVEILTSDEPVITTSECFDKAARKAVGASGNCVKMLVGYVSETQQSYNNPIIPNDIDERTFQNEEAISIAQGQYGTVTLFSSNTTNSRMLFAIMSIYVNNGHLPPITGIKLNYDDTTGAAMYEVELYARDSAISISAYQLQLTAVSFEAPAVRETLCVVEGTCCEEVEPT